MHRYVVFLTLTYSQEFVPRLMRYEGLSDADSNYQPTYEFKTRLNEATFQNFVLSKEELGQDVYCHGVQSSGCIECLCKRDVQNFLKRLRNLFSNKQPLKTYTMSEGHKVCTSSRFVGEEGATFRYCVAGEYGPRSFRPHYHLLLFFDSAVCSSHLNEMVSACWCLDRRHSFSLSFGRFDIQYVVSTAARYVASYVNSFSYLPPILQTKRLRPFFLASRQPFIGTYLPMGESIQQVFHCASCSRVMALEPGQPAVDVPLSNSIANSIFPKLPAFDKVSSYSRIELYRSLEELCRYVPKTFAEFKYSALMRVRLHFDEYSMWLQRYMNTKSGLRRLYSVSKRVTGLARRFRVSLAYYVGRIEDYWNNYKLFRLRQFYLAQQEDCLTKPAWYQLLRYPEFLSSLKACDRSKVANKYLYPRNLYVKLRSFSVPKMMSKTSRLKMYDVLDNLQEVKDYFAHQEYLHNKHKKSKKQNADLSLDSTVRYCSDVIVGYGTKCVDPLVQLSYAMHKLWNYSLYPTF